MYLGTKKAHTYVVVEDTTTIWGFDGFDADRGIQIVGSRKDCLDWIIANTDNEHNWIIVSLKNYEEGEINA